MANPTDFGNETERFIVTEHNGKFRVRDMQNGVDLRFGYNNPPLYATALAPADEWGNYYSARGFAQKMAVKNDPLTWRRNRGA